MLVPLVVAILAFALYPQQALEDAEPKVAQVVAAAAGESAVAQEGVAP